MGEVVEEDADFPSLFGQFYPFVATEDNPLRRQLQNYIDYSVAADKIMEEESNEKWEAYMEANEKQFMNLIEAEDWYLVYSDRIELVLIPNFCQNNGIVWRWNFFPENEDALSAAHLDFANFSASLLQTRLF